MSAWNSHRTFERSERAVAEGQLWRAKEILQGNIASQGPHAELYERYGRVLLLMGDLVDAGKYLFLCGDRDPECEEAIQLFVDKYHRDPQRIFSVLPARARAAPWEDLPAAFRQDMHDLGFTAKPHEPVREHRTTAKDTLVTSAFLLTAFVLLSCTVVGGMVLLRWAWKALVA